VGITNAAGPALLAKEHLELPVPTCSPVPATTPVQACSFPSTQAKLYPSTQAGVLAAVGAEHPEGRLWFPQLTGLGPKPVGGGGGVDTPHYSSCWGPPLGSAPGGCQVLDLDS
jgi:hypothetical protein